MRITKQRTIGAWYVEVDGVELPVGHNSFVRQRARYQDALDWAEDKTSPRLLEWVAAVKRTGKMVIQMDQTGTYKASGQYWGVASVDQVEYSPETGLVANLVARHELTK